MLAGVSAFALLIVALTLTEWPATDAASDRDAALVRGFYAAANEVLAGADGAALGPFIGPSAVTH
ncbi:MAG TPA: hypothetical protein VFI22_07125, partial [Thermomicrobiales bacterium]|nr:hypothetical protein [Thermomicrobiales bacterium]